MERVIIALATFKRPNMLSEALSSLKEVNLPEDFKVEIFLCDNDPEKSAQPVAKRFSDELVLRYFHEERRGIVYARNRLLEEANKVNARYLAFFDDDETVDKDWIINLLKTIQQFKAAAVSGKVIYQLPDDCPKWMHNRNFYGGDRPKTGTEVIGASTNNVLIDLDFLSKHQLSFNEKFNMSGGSDSMLFREVRDRGGKIVSSREAIAYEKVPLTRASEEWILKRSYKNGYTLIRRERERSGRVTIIFIMLGYGIWLRAVSFLNLFIYPFVDYSYKVFNRRRLYKMRGMLLSFKGKSYEEYRTIHGG